MIKSAVFFLLRCGGGWPEVCLSVRLPPSRSFFVRFPLCLCCCQMSKSITPSNDIAAGPVIMMWLSSAFHSMLSVPPSISMSLWRGRRPVRWAATAVAQAPVPQASVMPEPRSQTLMRIVPSAFIVANSMLQRWGKTSWCSRRGPYFSMSRCSTSSRLRSSQDLYSLQE